jgi:hypothetical protein
MSESEQKTDAIMIGSMIHTAFAKFYALKAQTSPGGNVGGGEGEGEGEAEGENRKEKRSKAVNYRRLKAAACS